MKYKLLFNPIEMKKYLFFAAMAGVALTGCVKEEASVSTVSESKIGFAAPVVSSVTRTVYGEIEENRYPTDEKFVVYAKYYADGTYTTWNEGTDYFKAEGDETAYESTVHGWSTDAVPGGKVYYWPKGKASLTFAAYSPSEAKSCASYDGQGVKFEHFTPGEVGKQFDLMYSDRAYNKTKVDKTGNSGDFNYNGVTLTFHHVLSAVVFKVQLKEQYANMTIRVQNIKLTGVKNKGDFSEGIEKDASGEKSEVPGDDDTPRWTLDATEAAVDYDAYLNAAWAANKEDYSNGYEVAATTAADITKEEGGSHLLLIPQDLTDVKIEITYSMDNGNAVVDYVKTIDLGTEKYSVWLESKRYIYTITFGLDKIYFNPEVLAWEDVNVEPVIEL